MKIENSERFLMFSASAAFGLSGGFAVEELTTEARTAAVFGLVLPLFVKLVMSLKWCKWVKKQPYQPFITPIFLTAIGWGIYSIPHNSEFKVGVLESSVVMTVLTVTEVLFRYIQIDKKDSSWKWDMGLAFYGGLGGLMASIFSSHKASWVRPLGIFVGGTITTIFLAKSLNQNQELIIPCSGGALCCPKRDEETALLQ